jgi:phage/plasmid-like protein (TIGR03299 family)
MTVLAEAPQTETVRERIGAVGRDFWKGIATDISEAQDADDVFRLAPDLDFTVEKSPLTAEVTTQWMEDGELIDEQTRVPVTGWVATTRTDTNEVLGIVSEQWQNYQNKQLTEFAEAMRGEIDAPYQRALVLFGGRVVGLELKLGEDMFVPGDPSPWQNHAFIWTGHDGRHALNIQRLKQRILCANQFSNAVANAIATFKVRHTKNMSVNLKDVYAALNMVAQYDKTFDEAMARLSATPMDEAHMADFAVELLPIPENTKNPIRTINARDSIRDLFTASETLEGVDFTAYRAFQAVGEYVDHYRTYRTPKGGTAADGRAVSIIEGSAQTLKRRAFQLLTA